MKYSKMYLKEKWDNIKWDIEKVLLADLEKDYVEFPENKGIRGNLNGNWEAIRRELGL